MWWGRGERERGVHTLCGPCALFCSQQPLHPAPPAVDHLGPGLSRHGCTVQLLKKQYAFSPKYHPLSLHSQCTLSQLRRCVCGSTHLFHGIGPSPELPSPPLPRLDTRPLPIPPPAPCHTTTTRVAPTATVLHMRAQKCSMKLRNWKMLRAQSQ